MAEQQEEKTSVSRRGVLVGIGAGAAGLVAGGVDGREVLAPKPAPEPRIPAPVAWVGRNLAQCTGCKHCEIACSKFHESNVIWPAASRVRVHEYPPSIEFPVLCYQCADAPCVRECPASALSVNAETGTIVIDTQQCLRISEGTDCTVCIDACPGDTIHIHPTENVPMFCDLCNGDPECVKVCPSQSLTANGVRVAAALPADVAAGLAKLYEVGEDPGAAAPELRGSIDVFQFYT
jgi:Fe-S-cluster-containing hydrogenase component 2